MTRRGASYGYYQGFISIGFSRDWRWMALLVKAFLLWHCFGVSKALPQALEFRGFGGSVLQYGILRCGTFRKLGYLILGSL